MRLTPKYKIFCQSEQVVGGFPTRILKFKRPKWKRIQKALTFYQKPSFIDSFFFKTNIKNWERIKSAYKDGLQSKSSFFQRFDSSVKMSFLKKVFKSQSLNTRDLLIELLVKPEFRIDILVWRAGFFNSIYQAKQSINNGDILINNKRVKSNSYALKGDIISFIGKDEFFQTVNSLSVRSSTEVLQPYIESDFYTKTIIVIKSYTELSQSDIQLFISEYLCINKLKNYIY